MFLFLGWENETGPCIHLLGCQAGNTSFIPPPKFFVVFFFLIPKYEDTNTLLSKDIQNERGNNCHFP